ncbi:TonB family protein [Alteromonas facilis]|uniref:TonB family protein n=1 Tax=Alteromonas facilis TaxID=2048004 RepID=UPI000C289137|nr:TonB family protein [Alteromonas facilis]
MLSLRALKRSILPIILSPILFGSTFSFASEDFSSVYNAYLEAFKQEDYTTALSLSQQALELGGKQFKENTDNYLNLRFNYANMLQQTKQHKEAYAEYQAVEEAFAKRDGEDAASVFPVRIERYYVATILARDDSDFAKAKRNIIKDLIRQVEELSAQQPDKSAFYHYGLVSILQRSNTAFSTLRKTIGFAEQAVEIMEQSFGATDQRLVESQFYLAKLYKNAKRLDAAAQQYEAIVEVLDDNLNYSHPWALTAHANLVDIFERKGESDKATAHCVAIGRMTPWDENILEPKPIFRTNPKYPVNYARAGREGFAKIEFDIDEYGFVINPRIMEVQGGNSFGDASVEALKQWRYAPKFINGEAQVANNRYVQMDFYIRR